MKKKSGNISILVIFVLLASSLLGILSMNFVQQMMKQSAVVHNYYKAYYLAKAGLEISLTQVANRGVGFEYTIQSGDAIVRENFFSGFDQSVYSLSTQISGMSMMLSKNFWQSTGCEHPYVLASNDTIIVPLFRDSGWKSVYDILTTWITYQNLAHIFKHDAIEVVFSEFSDEATFGILILSGDDLSPNGIFFQKGDLITNWLNTFRQKFETYLSTIDSFLYPKESQLASNYWLSSLIDNNFRMYLLISNSSKNQQEFCLSIEQSWTTPTISLLPTESFFLQSHASYAGQQVVLDAVYAQPIPWFLFGTYFSNSD